MVTKDRNKTARLNEQEYAHIYPPNGQEQINDYTYLNDDRRIRYRVDSDASDGKSRDEVYGVNPPNLVNATTPMIKVRRISDWILEDHRQRSYKIKNVPPVYSKTDPGIESYVQNDYRDDEMKWIEESSSRFNGRIDFEHSLDMSNPNDRFSLSIDTGVQDVDGRNLTVGSRVRHVEEEIEGVVRHIGKDRVAVVWDDRTRERLTFYDTKRYLRIIAYVDDAQQQVAPLETPQFPKRDDRLSNVIESGDDHGQDEIDIEKIKLQRKVNQLEEQVRRYDIRKIKERDARRLIDLMQKKGMLGTSEKDVQTQFDSIMAMDDVAFESFKNAVLDVNKAAIIDEVNAILSDETDDDGIVIEDGHEFARAMERVKKTNTVSRSIDGIEMGDTSAFENGGLKNFKGVIGDFSKLNNTMDQERIGSRKLNQIKRQGAVNERTTGNLDLSPFSDIEGLRVPVNIASKELTTAGKYKELFDGLDWTIFTKIH